MMNVAVTPGSKDPAQGNPLAGDSNSRPAGASFSPSPPSRFGKWFKRPPLTRRRVYLACAVALVTDGLQMALGPLGWAMADQILDGIAMILTTWLLGFHLLLLPTFLLEALPAVDMLPSWSACVMAVVTIRRRAESDPGTMAR